MTLTWYPPEDDGGSQVTGYIVERKEVRADRWVRVNKVPVTMTRYRSTGLIEGLEYEHRVTAINARGTGKPSRPSKPVVAMDPIGKYVLFIQVIFQNTYRKAHDSDACDFISFFKIYYCNHYHTYFGITKIHFHHPQKNSKTYFPQSFLF